jgi:hypothetical protein
MKINTNRNNVVWFGGPVDSIQEAAIGWVGLAIPIEGIPVIRSILHSTVTNNYLPITVFRLTMSFR